jgi:hypothetical protein
VLVVVRVGVGGRLDAVSFGSRRVVVVSHRRLAVTVPVSVQEAVGSVGTSDARRPGRRAAIAHRHLRELCDRIATAVSPPAWHERAACRGVGPAVFFPESSTPAASAAAMRYCAGCQVIEECRAASVDEPAGVWAGVVRVRGQRRVEKVAS